MTQVCFRKIFNHPAFKAIIALGAAVVPLIQRLQPRPAALVLPPGQKLSPARHRLFNQNAAMLLSGGKLPG